MSQWNLPLLTQLICVKQFNNKIADRISLKKQYGPSYANIGAVYTLEPLTRAQIILIRMTPPLWVASFVLYKNVNGISDRTLRRISGLYKHNDKLDKHIIVLYSVN